MSSSQVNKKCIILRAAKNSDFVRVVGFCAVLAGTRTDNFSSIRISLINARARSRNPDPDIRSHVRLEGVHIAYMNREHVVCDPVT